MKYIFSIKSGFIKKIKMLNKNLTHKWYCSDRNVSDKKLTLYCNCMASVVQNTKSKGGIAFFSSSIPSHDLNNKS